MSQPTQAAPADASRYLPLLLVLFAGSGCSALIYETVWYQLLQLAIGSTAVSLGCLLATFMGGLCIGSVWFPRLRLEGQHPLRIYAYLELGIAASALLVHVLLPLVNMAYIAGAEHGLMHCPPIHLGPVPAGQVGQDQPAGARHEPSVVPRDERVRHDEIVVVTPPDRERVPLHAQVAFDAVGAHDAQACPGCRG